MQVELVSVGCGLGLAQLVDCLRAGHELLGVCLIWDGAAGLRLGGLRSVSVHQGAECLVVELGGDPLAHDAVVQGVRDVQNVVDLEAEVHVGLTGVVEVGANVKGVTL